MSKSPKALCAAVLLVLVTACQSPERGFERTRSCAWDRLQETKLGRDVEHIAGAHPGDSGIYVLPTGADAFAARYLLAQHAERAIDAQTYILHRDVTGLLFLGSLLAAADRGVRVRLLVDDLNAREIEGDLAALDAHPSIEVRLFNPFSRSRWPGMARFFDFMWSPVRLNHRAHNKSISADGAAAIVGGRNIGDEYFDASPHVNFADLDLLAIGPVAAEVGRDFDAYWASPLAVPMEAWPSLRRTPSEFEQLRSALDEHAIAHRDSPYASAVRQSELVQHVLQGELPLVWAPTKSCADDPAKATAARDQLADLLLGREVVPIARDVQRDLILVSPYFVPGEAGVKWLRSLRERGARVRILTNSLAATDVPLVHAGYSRYRRKLLELGVELYELQSRAAERTGDDRHGMFDSSGASLHAKTFVFDQKTLFVGSLNFDPRSVELNTEQGLLVDSPELARDLVELFEIASKPSNAYRVVLEPRAESDAPRMVWLGEEDGRNVRFTSEPHAGFGKLSAVSFGLLLPIEGQL